MGFPGIYNLYMVSVAVLPEYRCFQAIRLLCDAFVMQLSRMAAQNILFSEICTNAYTKAGVSLCQTLGLGRIGPHATKRGEIYCGSMAKLLKEPFANGHTLLRNTYMRLGEDSPNRAALGSVGETLSRESQQFLVRHVENETELYQVWKLDHSAYGDDCWPYRVLLERWRAFPVGCQSAFLGGLSVSSFGMWPITKAFSVLLKGRKVTESSITVKMLREAQEKPVNAWYFSGIEVQPDLRGSLAVKRLLSRGLRNVWSSLEVGYPCEVLALAFSKEGEAILERFGFSRLGEIRARAWPLYRKICNDSDQFFSALADRGL